MRYIDCNTAIDPDKFADYFEKAKAMLPEDDVFEGIDHVIITCNYLNYLIPSRQDQPTSPYETSFTFNVTQKNHRTIRNAGKETIDYEKITFHVKPDGSLRMEGD